MSELMSINNSFFGSSLEDQKLFELLPDESGTYIDIGSGRPIRDSNTYFFYRRGWTGILVDPLTTNKRASRILRRKDLFIQGVVTSSKVTSLDFYEFLPYLNSTTIKELADRQRNTPGFYLVSKTRVRNININELLALSPQSPSLLSIDAEGVDLEIIKSISFEKNRPHVLVCEAWDDDTLEQLKEYLGSKEYSFYARCGNSVIFQFNSIVE